MIYELVTDFEPDEMTLTLSGPSIEPSTKHNLALSHACREVKQECMEYYSRRVWLRVRVPYQSSLHSLYAHLLQESLQSRVAQQAKPGKVEPSIGDMSTAQPEHEALPWVPGQSHELKHTLARVRALLKNTFGVECLLGFTVVSKLATDSPAEVPLNLAFAVPVDLALAKPLVEKYYALSLIHI